MCNLPPLKFYATSATISIQYFHMKLLIKHLH